MSIEQDSNLLPDDVLELVESYKDDEVVCARLVGGYFDQTVAVSLFQDFLSGRFDRCRPVFNQPGECEYHRSLVECNERCLVYDIYMYIQDRS
jgi:hypothetical protein